MIEIICAIAVTACICIVCIYFGFWMGRKTIDKPLDTILRLKEPPAVLDSESDPWRDAMTSKADLEKRTETL